MERTGAEWSEEDWIGLERLGEERMGLIRHVVTVLRENGELHIKCETYADALHYVDWYGKLGVVVKLGEEEVGNGDNSARLPKSRQDAQSISKCGQSDCPCAWLG